MDFLKLAAYPVWPDAINIQWELDNNELTGDYLFRVHLVIANKRQQDLSGQLRNKTNFLWRYTDNLLYTEARQHLGFEIVCTPPVINSRRNLEEFSRIISLYHGLNEREFLIAREITRREVLRFERKIGLRAAILKRRVFGPACTECIDKLSRICKKSTCTSCFGTKYVGGYYDPVYVWAEVEELPVIKQISDISTTEEKTAYLRMTNKVLVNKKDILVDLSNNNRWELSTEPEMKKYRTVPILQKAKAAMVSPKSIINKVPVDGLYTGNKNNYAFQG